MIEMLSLDFDICDFDLVAVRTIQPLLGKIVLRTYHHCATPRYFSAKNKETPPLANRNQKNSSGVTSGN